MLRLDLFERFSDLSIKIESSLVHKVVQPLVIEQSLDFREHCFNCIEFRTVADIEQSHDMQLLVVRLHIFRLVNRGIIHEQRKRLPTHSLRKTMKVVYEVFGIAGRFLNLNVNHASIFSQ